MSKKVKQGDVTRLLTRARNIVSDGWTRGVAARNKSKQEVEYDDPAACYHCAAGATAKARAELQYTTATLLEADRQLEAVLGGGIPEINDKRSTKQEHIFMAFDLARFGAGR